MLRVICGNCRMDRHLIIRSVTDMPAQPHEVALVSYTCSRCGTFDEHPAQVADLSQILARQPEQTGDVLIFGNNYMDCGQPMKKAGSAPEPTTTPGNASTATQRSPRPMASSSGEGMPRQSWSSTSAKPGAGPRNNQKANPFRSHTRRCLQDEDRQSGLRVLKVPRPASGPTCENSPRRKGHHTEGPLRKVIRRRILPRVAALRRFPPQVQLRRVQKQGALPATGPAHRRCPPHRLL